MCLVQNITTKKKINFNKIIQKQMKNEESMCSSKPKQKNKKKKQKQKIRIKRIKLQKQVLY